MATTVGRQPKQSRGQRGRTLAATAEAAGVSLSSLHRYFRSGLPRDATPQQVKEWREQNVRPRQRPSSNGAATDTTGNGQPVTLTECRTVLVQHQARREQAMAERVELENRQRAGELLAADDVQRAVAMACNETRRAVQQLGGLCANLAPTEMKVAIKELIDEQARVVLTQLAESLAQFGLPEADS